MMEYCELHKDLSDEEGDNCPLCECMDSKALALGRLANEVAAIRSLVKEMAECIEMSCKGYWGRKANELLNRPEVKAIMEGK